jgi:caffeoyl-CoA O-methyltransferase
MTLSFSTEEIENYCINKSRTPSRQCQAIYDYTKANIEMSQMLIGPLEASFLQFLIRLTKTKTVLEIGTFTGYSALAMAEALPKDGKVVTLDINPKTTEIAQSFWIKSQSGKKITAYLGTALDRLKMLKEHHAFDFVFIDADKPNYRSYFKEAMTMLSPGGIIAVDNCLWSGRVLEDDVDVDTKGIKSFNDFVRSSDELTSTLLPMRDGLHLIQRKE